jgi:hypothetical protein
MYNQKYNSVPEMVAEDILKTKKYLKAMKRVSHLMKRKKPVEDVREALNDAKNILEGHGSGDSMLKEKILEYLYDINARCDYKLEEVADDIVAMINEEAI